MTLLQNRALHIVSKTLKRQKLSMGPASVRADAGLDYRRYPNIKSLFEGRMTEDDPSNGTIVFLGGIFTPDQTAYVLKHSRGVIQSAADAFQQNLIRGLAATEHRLVVINLPFIGSFPRGFAKTYFPGTHEKLHSGIEVFGIGFSLLRVVKPFSRFLSALTGLMRAGRQANSTVVVYSAHLPFLFAAILHRAFRRATKICLVLPDFPEFMGEGGWRYRIVKSVESRIFYALAARIDYFVLLTSHMADRLRIETRQFTVVEGIAADTGGGTFKTPVSVSSDQRIFLYSGTLASRYGILRLVEAFRRVENPSAKLWICGDGDSRDQVIQASRLDQRIHYFGQIPRAEVLRLQSEATVLVNPRPPEGEYTKYSFPSKTTEYMASGRPVLMYDLPGVPREYRPYFFKPASTSVEDLASAISELAQRPADDLRAFGVRAREFVLEEKNAVMQCRKISNLISRSEVVQSATE